MRFISYAQNFEDVMLWRALRQVKDGFYIDIGAADPVEMSVTRAFYDRGWRGINVEPTIYYFERLQAARPQDANLDIAIGSSNGRQDFFEIEKTGLSSLDAEVAASHRRAGWPVSERQIAVLTLAEICRRHAPSQIHFLKIDVEGAEAAVLAGADFQKYRPWIVVLEATRPLSTAPAAAWEADLLAAQYQFVWFDGLNRFYIADEHFAALREHFELPPNSFDAFDVYDAKTEQFRAERIAVEGEMRGRLNEIRLLEAELDLWQRKARILAENNLVADKLQENLTAAQAILVARHQQLVELEVALAREHLNWRVLTRLAHELRWEDGPRALRLVLPVARLLRKFLARGHRGAPPVTVEPQPQPAPAPPIVKQAPAVFETRPQPTNYGRRAVHQFHPGSEYGDAVTNSMLLTRRILRALGYRSEIYVQYRDEALKEELFLLDDLPVHDDYVLIVLHSLGYYQTERIAALPAPKILMYHNITPAIFLRGISGLAALADLGREQLDYWRPRVEATLAVSPFNALELRKYGYDDIGVCPLLFDIEALRARARPGQGRNADDPLTILFVGRVVESKGQVDLVDAFDLFRRHYNLPCRLVLVGRYEKGGSAYVEALFERIGGHGMRQIVEVTGQITDEEVDAWYDRADLYVSVSQHEGFGVPLIEAMAHDVPVIAYGAGATPDTMSSEASDPRTVLASRAATDVAAAMLTMAEDPALRMEVVARQRRNLNRFHLKHHIPVLVQALLRAGARPPVTEQRREIAGAMQFVVSGHVNGTYSLAGVNRTMAIALNEAAPGRVRVRPVETTPTEYLGGVPAADAARIGSLVAAHAAPSGPTVVISQHYPVYVPPRELAADLTAAFFFWEESLVPAATIAVLNEAFGAVFAPSKFVAKSLQDSGLAIPVRVVGYAPRLENFSRLVVPTRPVRGFTFLHVSSTFPRKGLDVLLAAFAQAFAGTSDNVRLVVKTFPNPHNDAALQVERLRVAHPDLPDIELIDRDIGEDELLGLYREADAMILPTRGEGFNLPAAEAMAAGLPLVVTGAGGHADFVTEDEALLLPSRAAPSRSHFADGRSLWFEPDVAALAAAMRAVLDDPAAARARAAAARRAVASRLCSTAWADRLIHAANQVLLAPKPAPLRYAFVSSWDVRCGVAEYTRHLVTVFQTLTAPRQLAVICDDRAAPRSDAAVRVVPGWTLGSGEIDRIAAAISREDPAVIMIQHQPGLLSWSSLVALLRDARLRQRVVVVTLHATSHLTELPTCEQEPVLDALRGAARVVVHRLADLHFLADLNLNENVTMIPQGVPPMADLPPVRALAAGDAPLIGSYGFLLPPKGLRELIAALSVLRERWPGARLRLVNALHDSPDSAAEFQACQDLAKALGVSEHVEWHTAFLPYESSMALLRDCDLIVLAYARTQESSSAALRSCLASGTPVAVTPIAIFDEAGDAVFRLAGQSPADIAAGIVALLANTAARTSLQLAATLWAAPRSWTIVGQRLHGMVTGLAVNAALDRDAATAPPGAAASRPIVGAAAE